MIWAQNPHLYQLKIDKGRIKSYLKNLLMLLLMFYVLRTYIW